MRVCVVSQCTSVESSVPCAVLSHWICRNSDHQRKTGRRLLFLQKQARGACLLWISAIDMLFVSLWKIKLPLWRGRTVVADRYVIDALVDLMDDTGITDLNSYPYMLLLGLLNRCSVTAVLTVDEEESLRRKDDSISSAYLSKRRKLYESVTRDLHIPVIDAKPSIEVVWSNLIDVLYKQMAQPE